MAWHVGARVERGARFALGAVFPVYLSFHEDLMREWFHVENGGFLVGILYVILAALCPPNISSVAVAAGCAFIGVLLGAMVATVSFYAVCAGDGSTALGYVTFVAMCVPLSALKIGKFERLTGLTLLVAAYAGVLLFTTAIGFVADGLSVTVGVPEIIRELEAHETTRALLPPWGWAVIEKIDADLARVLAHEKVLDVNITVDVGELRGRVVHITARDNAVTVATDGGCWIADLLWEGTGMLSSIQSLLICFGVSLVFLAGGLLLPWPRTARGVYLRNVLRMLHSTEAADAAVDDPGAGADDGADEGKALCTATIVDIDHWAVRGGDPASRALSAIPRVSRRLEELAGCAAAAQFEPAWRVQLRLLDRVHAAAVRVALLEEYLLPILGSEERTVTAAARGDARAGAPHQRLLRATNRQMKALQATERCGGCCACCDDLDADGGEDEDTATPTKVTPAAVAACTAVRELHSAFDGYITQMNAASLGGCLGSVFLMCIMLPQLIVVGTTLASVFAVLCVHRWLTPKVFARPAARYRVQWVCGLAWALALPTFSHAYRTWGNDDNRLYYTLDIAGKFGGWTALGFLVCHLPSVEETTHKALLRVAGTLTGGACGYLAVYLVGTDSPGGLTAWLCVSFFIAVAASANPHDPLIGAHPSYGYAFQLFTYTEAIIVLEAYNGVGSAAGLTVSRILGQLAGIAIALVVTHLILPVSLVASSQHALAEALEAFAEATHGDCADAEHMDAIEATCDKVRADVCASLLRGAPVYPVPATLYHVASTVKVMAVVAHHHEAELREHEKETGRDDADAHTDASCAHAPLLCPPLQAQCAALAARLRRPADARAHPASDAACAEVLHASIVDALGREVGGATGGGGVDHLLAKLLHEVDAATESSAPGVCVEM